ncbi:probable sulfate transporter 3.4 [Tanacetum coccineum]
MLQLVNAAILLILQDGSVEEFSLGQDSSFVPPLIYFVLGSSRHLTVGPVSIASWVMGTMLNKAVPYPQDQYSITVLDKLEDTNLREFKRVKAVILLILQDGSVEEFSSGQGVAKN